MSTQSYSISAKGHNRGLHVLIFTPTESHVCERSSPPILRRLNAAAFLFPSRPFQNTNRSILITYSCFVSLSMSDIDFDDG